MTSYLFTLLASFLIILLTALAISVLPWRSEDLDCAEQELKLICRYLKKRFLTAKIIFVNKFSIQQAS